MTLILFKPIFFLLIFSLIMYVKTRDCKMIYMIPIGPEKPDNDIHSSNALFSKFLGDCLTAKKKNTFVSTLDVVYNSSFTCLMNEHYSRCGDLVDNNRLNLNRSQYYGIKNFLDKQIEKDGECGGNQALAIFPVYIPCVNHSFYPDVDEMFGTGLEKTQKYLVEKNLHYLFVLLYKDSAELTNCNKTILGMDFTQTSNIKTSVYRSLRNLMVGDDACSTDVPIFPLDYHNNSVKQDSIVSQVVISVVCGVILGLIALFIAFWARQIWRRWEESKIEAFANEHTSSTRHLLFGKYKDEWEVTPKELRVDQGEVLGQGAFGTVYKGHLKKQRNKEWIEMDVAVKFTHDHSTEQMRQDMIEEIGFTKALGSHENLLVMVGYLKSIESPLICTVFCSNGDLLGILRKHDLHFMSSNKCENVEICLLLPDLLRLAIEVCNGLCYLASLNYIHRDIAARNVLLTDKMTAKLSDFGMCKKLELGEVNIVDKKGKFPVKYMPYESLRFGEFSEKTDVWAFGILLFEMFSGGKKPFKNIPNEQFIDHLEANGKPIMPELTPQPIVQLLNNKVFQKYPSRRADFKEIKKDLSDFYSIVSNVLLSRKSNSQCGSFKSLKKH